MNGTPGSPALRDLGEREGPLLVFGGPLSNLEAVDALFGEARSRGIGPDRMICTGDVAGYCADPEPCVKALRESGIATVMGNVEEALGADADDCGCNFVEGSACDALAGRWYSHARTRISAESRAWMAALPRMIRFRLGGRTFVAIHGGAKRINRYVFASDIAAMAEEFAGLDGNCTVIAGHAGLPFTAPCTNNVWHNTGSLGMPANDGTPRVWFSIIAVEGAGVRFTHVPLTYGVATAQAKMRKAGLPDAYADALGSGLWPDTAVLPDAEARATGTALAPVPFVWG